MNLDLFKKRRNQDGDGVGAHGVGTLWGGNSVGRHYHRNRDRDEACEAGVVIETPLQVSNLIYSA